MGWRMSLRDTELVDFIVENPHTEGFDLIALDSGDIEDPTQRYNCMIEKLKNYLCFVLDGQLYEQNPQAKEKPIRFCIISDIPPNEAMLKVEAIKPHDDPSACFPVAFYSQNEYFE